jgi:deoxyribose-phosphate aldolase
MDLTDEQWKAKIKEIASALAQNPIPEPTESFTDINPDTLASYIDHTVLKLDATEADIDTMCQEAIKYNFAVSRILPDPHLSPSLP